jgi:uncharacterized protein (TIGR03435 family)
MNRLQEALKREPVAFIAVTDEKPDKIAQFLKTHEIKSWVGIDQSGSAFKAFKVVGRPDGYLIGKDGELLARIYPADLNEKDVRAAIAGKFKPRRLEWPEPKAPEKQGKTGAAIFEITISSASGKGRMVSYPDKLEICSLPFINSIAFIWGVEENQVILDTQPVNSFNVMLKTSPEVFDKGRDVLKAAVEAAFHIRVMPETKETDVYVLALSTAPGAPRPKPGAPEAQGLISYGGGNLVGTDEMPKIAAGIWASVDRPVVDETGLKGTYEFELQWKSGDQAEAEKILSGQGLVLVPARREIDFLRVIAEKP